MPKIRLRDGLGEVKLKYLCEDTDRHGNVRIYVCKPGHKKIRLKETPGTRAFLDEYYAAINNRSSVQEPKGTKRYSPEKDSLRWLCVQYYKSAPYRELGERTRYVRKSLLDRICEKDGDKPYALMEPRHVRARRDQNADRPEAANAMVKALRQLYGFAIEYDLATTNPAKDVPYLKSHSEGFHSWSMEELSKFEDRHAVGSKARLALALTGC